MKNANNCRTSSMNWKITSKIIDVAEIAPNDTQNIYIVYVNDGVNNIEASEAYGIDHRTEVTKKFIEKYSQYIDKIEHEE
jgi:hypothetical protein